MPRKGSKEALQLEVEKLKGELAKARDEARPAPATLVQLGAPPDDTLEAEKYLLRANMINAHEVINDPTLSPKDRWRWIQTISETVHKLVPKARIYEAEQVIKSDRADIERRKPRGAKLEPAPAERGAEEKKGRKKRKEKKPQPARRSAAAQLVPAPKP
jgi:hypothetical protein